MNALKRACVRALATIGALALLATPVSSLAAEHNQDAEITINFRDAELLAVLEFYSQLTGKVFVPSEQVQGRVTIISPDALSERQAIKLLFSVLDMRGFAVVEVDDYYKVIPKPNALNAATPALNRDLAGDRLVTAVLTPKHLQVASMVQSATALVSQEGRLVVDPTLNFIVVTDTAAKVRQLSKLIARIDQPTTMPTARTYQLQYAKVDAVAPLLQNLLTQTPGDAAAAFAPAPAADGVAAPSPTTGGSGNVLFDTRSNTLIVTALEVQHQEVERVLRELDTRSAQVLLEATIVEVTLDDSSKLGVQWSYILGRNNGAASARLTENASGGPISTLGGVAAASGFNFALLDPDDLAIFVNLIAEDSKARVLSSPHLMASNNQEASLLIGDEVPILKETRFDVENRPIETFDREQIGLEVKITPSIAKNRDVSLDLLLKISSVVAGSVNARNQFTTADREVQTNVVVRDQQTLVISGLMQNDSSKSNAGVPFLRNVPGLGRLFGSESAQQAQGELLILITPHVLATEQEAGLAGDNQLRKHPNAADAGAINHIVMEFDL